MDPVTVIGLVNFIPAIVALYFVLGEFEGYFKDNKALFMVIVGLGIGMVISFFSLFYFPLEEFLLALGVVVLIEVVKFFILLQKPFRLNPDTPFYGLALGTGIGAMITFTYSYAAGFTELSFVRISFIFLLSYNYTFVNASTGAVIAFGSSQGEFWRYLFRGVMLNGLHALLMTFIWSLRFGEIGSVILLVVGSIYVTLLMFHVWKNLFPASIPEEIKEIKEKEE